jgi:hypothetical protein
MSESQRATLALLAEVWSLAPDVRLGQLVAHIGFLGEDQIGRGLGYLEDDEFAAVLLRHRAELVARLQGNPNPVLARTGPNVSLSGDPIPQ